MKGKSDYSIHQMVRYFNRVREVICAGSDTNLLFLTIHTQKNEEEEGDDLFRGMARDVKAVREPISEGRDVRLLDSRFQT